MINGEFPPACFLSCRHAKADFTLLEEAGARPELVDIVR